MSAHSKSRKQSRRGFETNRQVVCVVADMQVLLSIVGIGLYHEQLVHKGGQIDGLQHKQLDSLDLHTTQ